MTDKVVLPVSVTWAISLVCGLLPLIFNENPSGKDVIQISYPEGVLPYELIDGHEIHNASKYGRVEEK